MSINDGLALIRRHDFEGALPLLAAEVRKRPDDAYAAYYLAYAFVGAQDPQPAVTLLAKIIEVHPDFTDARSLLGLARIRISDFVGASTEYETVLAREPKNPAALLGLGMIAYWKRETAVAEDYLDRALRGDPSARDALIFKADLRYAAGDVTGAVMLLRDAKSQRRPAFPEVSDSEIADRLLRYAADRPGSRRLVRHAGLGPVRDWRHAGAHLYVGRRPSGSLERDAALPGRQGAARHTGLRWVRRRDGTGGRSGAELAKGVGL